MNLTAVFTSSGAPAIGKSPVISGWTLAGSLVISGASMTEVAGGFYTYDFTDYNYLEDYVFVAYESSLGTGEQYVYLTNDNDSQNNQGIIKQILGLSQGNFVMTGQTYDVNGRLLTAIMHTYDTAIDASTDSNRLHTYNIVSTYDGNGNLTGYRVVEA